MYDMQIDKQAAHIAYNDAVHQYRNLNNNRKYISVTTLIHQYVPEFKAEYWSTYKALKDVMENNNPDIWYQFKRKAGGWEKAVGYYNKQQKGKNKSLDSAVSKRATHYIKSWDDTRNNACELGSDIHLELENAAIHSQQIRDEKTIYEVSQDNILAIQDFNSNGVYPELLIYNDEYAVAGQADKVFKRGNVIDIHDYKTCKAIDYEGFRGETLLTPFQHIQNANYWIYELQLSMYAYMLEQCGYEVGSLQMHWIYGDDPESNVRDKVKTFTLKYKRSEVKLMMELNIF
jgi:hypothetical protein